MLLKSSSEAMFFLQILSSKVEAARKADWSLEQESPEGKYEAKGKRRQLDRELVELHELRIRKLTATVHRKVRAGEPTARLVAENNY